MIRYITRRLIFLVPTVLFVSVIIFGLMNILPGDVARMILVGPGGDGNARAEDMAVLREQLGLDRPLVVRYADWLWGVVRLDVGNSLWSSEPVFKELKQRFPLSIELAVMASVLSILIAIPSGVISAVKQGTWVDYVMRVFSRDARLLHRRPLVAQLLGRHADHPGARLSLRLDAAARLRGLL
jgi:peptide/nickel transport system permease protein